MIPPEARDILMYYGGILLVGVILFLVIGSQRRGMRLRLRGGKRSGSVAGGPTPHAISGNGLSHVQPSGERPLNVIFNYNGHSWDAYEVLGLAAGSSLEKVERAFHAAMRSMEPTSQPFLEAAYQAIRAEWKAYQSARGAS